MPKIKRVLIRGGGVEHQIYPNKTYRYFRWNISAVKSNVGTTQASEFEICDNSGNKMPRPSGTTITANHPGNNNEGIEKLIDGSTSTKYCTPYNPQIVITIDFGVGNGLNINSYPKYKWYTANDVADRDPNSRTIEVSDDGNSWEVMSTITNANVTGNRNTLAGTWDIKQ